MVHHRGNNRILNYFDRTGFGSMMSLIDSHINTVPDERMERDWGNELEAS
jgi:hypothetical protein